MTDLVVRGDAFDVAIADGLVEAVGPDLLAGGAEELDARGLVVLPGAVDGHVHLNDPGRAHWEGFATGTAAMVAGGTTTGIDMPLNASPPTVDGASFDRKVAAADGLLRADVALWGGLVPGDLDRLDELAARGVVGFKAFASDSGIEDFPAADDVTLHEGMVRAARLGLPVAVHAEHDGITRALGARARAAGDVGMRAWCASRPPVAELEAVARCLAFAEATGCALHLVHLSTAAAVRLVADARGRGVDVTCETCPHYLLLDEDDAVRLGAVAKCAPPLRAVRMTADGVDLLGSDHSPSPPSMKATGSDVLAAWGGIAGAQVLLATTLDLGLDAAELLGRAPARRFGLPGKGELVPGRDADLVLWDPAGSWTVTPETLHDRHRLSPYLGRTFGGRHRRTLLRGRTVAVDGVPVGPPTGRVLRRASA